MKWYQKVVLVPVILWSGRRAINDVRKASPMLDAEIRRIQITLIAFAITMGVLAFLVWKVLST
jgi:hypothetical protein